MFNTSNSHPEFMGGYVLDSFYVYKNTEPIISITEPTNANSEFITAYTFTYETNNPTAHRLFLTEIKQISGIEELVYTINYENKELLEGYGSLNKDDFGYYNGGDFKNSNKTHLKKGVLTSITYPTGGVKEFHYEPNTFGFVGDRQFSFEELFGNTDNRIPLSKNKTYSTTVQTPNFNTSNDVIIIYIPVDQDVELITSNLYGNSLFLSQCDFIFEPKKLLPGIPFSPYATYQPTFTTNQFADDFEREGGGFSLTVSQTATTIDRHLQKGFYFVRMTKIDQYVNPDMPNHLNGEISANLQINYATLKTTNLSKFLFGGGLRIRQIISKDLGDIKDKTVFDYTRLEIDTFDTIDGILSSGSMDLKTFKRKYILNKTDFYKVGCRTTIDVSYEVTEYSNPVMVQQTKGGYVGYKDVTVKKMNGLDSTGRIEYTYTSPIDYTVYPTLYGFPFIPVVDNDYKRGNLKKVSTYDKYGQQLNEKINEYSYVENTVFTQLFTGASGSGSNPWDRYYDNYEYSYSNPKITNSNPECCENPSPNPELFPCLVRFFGGSNTLESLNVNSLVTSVQNHTTGDARLTWSETKDFFYNGSTGTNTISISEYEYNNLNNQVNKERLKFAENGLDVVLEKTYLYSVDNLNSYTGPEESARVQLLSLNKVNELIYTSVSKNGILLQSEKIGYKEFSGNVLPETIYTSKIYFDGSGGGMGNLNETFEPRLQYKQYDVFGNPLEIEQTGGITLSYIWGYNKTLPIAKIENATNAQILSVLGGSDFASYSEANLSAINGLRSSLPNSMVTTFTHKPLIGVETVTDPKGYIMTYDYDEFNRLKKVTDADGKIVTENLYHYRTQN